MGDFGNTYSTVHEEAFHSIVAGEIVVWEALEAELRKQGVPITVGRLIPLHCLVDGPMHLQELTERIHAKPSAASRLVERMVRDGLVEKHRDGRDGRAVLLRATDEGRRVESAGQKVFESCARELFGDFSDDEVRMLCTLLARMRRPSEGADS